MFEFSDSEDRFFRNKHHDAIEEVKAHRNFRQVPLIITYGWEKNWEQNANKLGTRLESIFPRIWFKISYGKYQSVLFWSFRHTTLYKYNSILSVETTRSVDVKRIDWDTASHCCFLWSLSTDFRFASEAIHTITSPQVVFAIYEKWSCIHICTFGRGMKSDHGPHGPRWETHGGYCIYLRNH